MEIWQRSNQSILKEISPGCSLERMMLKLKLQYFGHLMQRLDSLEKTLMLEGMGGQEEKGTTEDKMAGWHHRLDGRESEWTPGDGDGQGGLACYNSWGCKELDTTEQLNWTELKSQDGKTVETVSDFIFGGSKITPDDDCSREMKRSLLLGRKVMTNLDSIVISRDITLPTKVCLVKAMVFPVVMYVFESWTVKKAECWRIDAFELWC